MVGWSRSFDFACLAATATAARDSGRLLATNEDPTHPTPDGLMPGFGRPAGRGGHGLGRHPRDRRQTPRGHGPTSCRNGSASPQGDPSVVMVGDQPRTDGRLAERLGIPFGLVDSGVTPAGTTSFDVPSACGPPTSSPWCDSCLEPETV